MHRVKKLLLPKDYVRFHLPANSPATSRMHPAPLSSMVYSDDILSTVCANYSIAEARHALRLADRTKHLLRRRTKMCVGSQSPQTKAFNVLTLGMTKVIRPPLL